MTRDERHIIDVSVVIPAFNREQLLPRALGSVDAQRDLRPREVIVVDDASSDASAAVAERLGARVIRRERNGGAAAARNLGVRAAQSEWVALLDSDDEWLPDHLATLWALRGDWSFVGGAALHCSALDMPVRYHGPLSSKPVVLDTPARLYPENFIPASGVLAHRDTMLAVGGYSENLRYAEDLDLWIRMIERRPAIVTPVPVARWWRHAGQKSTDDEGPRATQLEIVAGYRGRSWWSPQLVERNRAVRGWDALRAALAARRWPDAAREARSFADQRRLRALAMLLARRWRVRRISSRVDAEGRPTTAVLSADARWAAGGAIVDLSRAGTWHVVRRLVRRPPGQVAGGPAHLRLLARALGISSADSR